MVFCSKKRKTNSEYGLLQMPTQEKLPVYILEDAIKKVQKACGIHCLLFIVNVRFHIPVFGIHMQKFSRQGVIGLQQKAAIRQIILNT